MPARRQIIPTPNAINQTIHSSTPEIPCPKRSVLIASSLCLGLLVAGCSTKPVSYGNGYAPKITYNAQGVPNLYRVKAGDTVSEIAQRYRLNYRQIGAINNLNSQYTIHVGQWLKLWGNGSVPAYQATRQPTRPTYQASSNVPTNNAPTNYRPAPTPANQIGAYAYPSNNQVIKTFNPNSGTMGMWFAGRQGDPVKASQAGTVMYAGNELAEYGNLVMIRHDQTYITAYAHLNQILVQEGQTVQQGQRIATMGNTGTNNARQVALEFQVRKDGTPVDPRAVLSLQ